MVAEGEEVGACEGVVGGGWGVGGELEGWDVRWGGAGLGEEVGGWGGWRGVSSAWEEGWERGMLGGDGGGL